MREQVGNQRLYEFHSEQHFIEPPRGWGGAAWQAPGSGGSLTSALAVLFSPHYNKYPTAYFY